MPTAPLTPTPEPVPDQDQDTLVSVGRFLDPTEAQLAKGMLESSGIEVFLQGANANAIVPLAFRVRLSVRRQDEDTARVLLADAELAD